MQEHILQANAIYTCYIYKCLSNVYIYEYIINLKYEMKMKHLKLLCNEVSLYFVLGEDTENMYIHTFLCILEYTLVI